MPILTPKAIYETEEHKEAENKFLKRIEERFNCCSVKLPIRWEIDYLFDRYDNKTGKWWGVSWGELKCRTHESTKYSTVICGEHKIKHGINVSNRLGRLPFILFVRFTDRDLWSKLPKDKDDLLDYKRERWTARNHKDDRTDTEWVIHLPIELFKEF